MHNGLVLSQMSHELSRMVAPALAGLMIGVTWFGLGGVFLAGAATSVMALVFATRLPQLPRRATSTASGLSDLASAVRYVRTTHKLGAVSLSAVGVILCGFPYLVLLPALATDRFGAGPVEFGVMSGTAGLGALVAGMGGASLEALVGPAALVPASGTVAGISVLALSIAGSLPVALGALLVIGASLMVFQTSAQAYMMQLAEPAYHGRVQSILVFGYSGAMLAAFPIGLLADVLSLRDALVVMGVGILLFVAPAMARGGGAHRPAVADRGDRQAGSRRGRSASAAARKRKNDLADTFDLFVDLGRVDAGEVDADVQRRRTDATCGIGELGGDVVRISGDDRARCRLGEPGRALTRAAIAIEHRVEEMPWRVAEPHSPTHHDRPAATDGPVGADHLVKTFVGGHRVDEQPDLRSTGAPRGGQRACGAHERDRMFAHLSHREVSDERTVRVTAKQRDERPQVPFMGRAAFVEPVDAQRRKVRLLIPGGDAGADSPGVPGRQPCKVLGDEHGVAQRQQQRNRSAPHPVRRLQHPRCREQRIGDIAGKAGVVLRHRDTVEAAAVGDDGLVDEMGDRPVGRQVWEVHRDADAVLFERSAHASTSASWWT